MMTSASDRQLVVLTVVVFGALALVVAAILRLMVHGPPRGRR
jgi:hypothetical protein